MPRATAIAARAGDPPGSHAKSVEETVAAFNRAVPLGTWVGALVDKSDRHPLTDVLGAALQDALLSDSEQLARGHMVELVCATISQRLDRYEARRGSRAGNRLLGGQPVVWLEGVSGCVALTHVQVSQAPALNARIESILARPCDSKRQAEASARLLGTALQEVLDDLEVLIANDELSRDNLFELVCNTVTARLDRRRGPRSRARNCGGAS